jgi:hypothetical protein
VVLQVAEKEDPGWTGVKTDFHFRATSPIWRITQNFRRSATKTPGLPTGLGNKDQEE